MKIKEVSNGNWGKVFSRISDAFKRHAPAGVEFVTGGDYDVCIIHAVGGEEYLKAEKEDLSKVVLVQHCVYTTSMPIEMWAKMWEQCKSVVSFHNLPDYTDAKFNFLRTPWGAEPDLFPILNLERKVKVFTTGHVASTECLDSIYDACVATNSLMIHTGEKFKWNPNNYSYSSYLPDGAYNTILNKVQYVAGLRLIEGFECHCIEGAMTGAVPIVPDLPTYDFYKDFGILLDINKSITDQLVTIFGEKSYKSLDYDIIKMIRDRFSYKNIMEKIYKEAIL